MPFEEAERAQACRIAGFLSATEVSRLESACLEMRGTCGAQSKTRFGQPTAAVGASWTTTFLHTGGEFQSREPELLKRICDLADQVNSSQGWGMDMARGSVRCVEHHEYLAAGGLADPRHRDTGSLVTVDIMLSEAESGGKFCTLEVAGELREHSFTPGDAIVFPSHKPHCVSEVTAGRRSVLIVEIWPGPERKCAHRCTRAPDLECGFTVEDSFRDQLRLMQWTAYRGKPTKGPGRAAAAACKHGGVS